MFFRPLSTGLLSFLAGSLLSVSAALAVPMDYSFTYTNAINGGGVVTGVVRGLQEGTGAATSVEVLSNTLNFGIGEYVGDPLINSWTVAGGVIIAFDFLSLGFENTSPAVTNASLFFVSHEINGVGFRAGLANDPFSISTFSSGASTQDFGLTFEQLPSEDMTAIPLPAGAPLLLTGIAALVVLRRRNRNT
ncbi:MAG: VPLPA-CTERM sorting domain-containing protein [Pseudomonadota bacterium]